MRIQILKDAKVVFVHDPILLQDKSNSYLIDWGEKDRNASAKAYIRQNSKNTDPILHTFLYPVKKDAWFYVGAMSWKPIDIGWTVWATLSAKVSDMCLANLSLSDRLLMIVQEWACKQDEEPMWWKFDDGRDCSVDGRGYVERVGRSD